MADAIPSFTGELVWARELQFDATAGTFTIPIDGNTVAGPSPVQLLAVALAGCMSIDVVDILRRGRHPLTSYACTVTGARRPTPPKRFTAFTIHYRIGGAVPASAIERAVALSKDKYCSVWHSLREDISLTTTFDVLP